ncbi:Lipopolysaccharide heptosyltransferase I [hydrothermal vent metagenome]|uniref:Lipopolysaccharide heptosyltransferase 1 n=1 Tax=hydrothermal vent metagenome TaxID=652676 RepID=A0A1W1C3F2_9ZZZZ
MNREIKRIAIVRLSALGDIVNSAVVVQFIKQKYPNAKIDWITEEIFGDIVTIIEGVQEVHTINLKQLKREKSFKLLKQNISKLRTLGEYDSIIDMQGLLKSAIVARLIGKNTHGFDKDSTRESLASLFYKTTSHIAYSQNIVKRNCGVVGDALGFTITDKMILEKKALFQVTQSYQLCGKKRNIAFVIGASWQSKIYPKEQFAKICNTLEEQTFIIWGNESERADAEWICKHSEYAELAPAMDLKELVAFISHLDLVIGNDTGPTHIAWAQNIPSITLFGPTNRRMLYETPKNRAIESPSNVNIMKIDKNDFSIREIPYEKIIKEARRLLDGL